MNKKQLSCMVTEGCLEAVDRTKPAHWSRGQWVEELINKGLDSFSQDLSVKNKNPIENRENQINDEIVEYGGDYSQA